MFARVKRNIVIFTYIPCIFHSTRVLDPSCYESLRMSWDPISAYVKLSLQKRTILTLSIVHFTRGDQQLGLALEILSLKIFKIC